MMDLDIARWLTTSPRDALTAAAGHVKHRIPDRVGELVALILLDHITDPTPDPNIHELAHTLLVEYTRGLGDP